MGPFREGGIARQAAHGGSLRDSYGPANGLRGPLAASYAFITIGRNKYAGLAAGGDFLLRAARIWAWGAATC